MRNAWGQRSKYHEKWKSRKIKRCFDEQNDGWTLLFNLLQIRRFQRRRVPICLLPTPYDILFFNFTTRLSSLSMNYLARWCKRGFGDTRLLAPRFYVTTAVGRGANNEHGEKFWISREEQGQMAECLARRHGYLQMMVRYKPYLELMGK